MTYQPKKLNLIAATDMSGVLSVDGQIPWDIKRDLKLFKDTTYGSSVIMGRTTFETLKKPLEGRQNIVLTSNTKYTHPDITVVHSKEQAIEAATESEIFIIGGSQIYELFWDDIDKIYLSLIPININIPNPNSYPTFLRNIYSDEWSITHVKEYGNGTPTPFIQVIYECNHT